MKTLVVSVMALLFAAFAWPQQNPQGEFLVGLNVSAVDSHGEPAGNLQATDFQIFDNGKPRKIVEFTAVPNRGSGGTGTVFILLDLFNADIAARGLSENEIVHALQRLESGNHVYLYLLSSTAMLYAVHGVPNAGAPQNTEDGEWTRNAKPLLDAALKQVNGLKPIQDRYSYFHIQPTWQALANLTSQLAQVPGPKSFVWITQGIENGFMEPGHEMVIDTLPLRRFAADLNKLETVADSVQQRPNGSIAMDNTGSPGDTLQQLSALTGGHAYTTDTTEEAISNAVNNPPRMNYQLSFAPDRLDGKYHKLRVTVDRKDVKIQTSQGYYAAPLPGAVNSRAK